MYSGSSISDMELGITVRHNHKQYYDLIAAFDIETSSGFMLDDGTVEAFSPTKYYQNKKYYEDTTKVSICYLWSVVVENKWKFIGRKIEDFLLFLNDLSEMIGDNMFIIYCHNLAFEAHFLANVIPDMTVFARHAHKPIYCTWRNVEFRCSYMLTRLSLDNWGESYKLGHHKMVGAIDYNIIRTPNTKLSQVDFDYNLTDNMVVVDGIRQYKERYKYVCKIPLTQTGIVRKEINRRMINEHTLHKKMVALIPSTLNEYVELMAIFGGGLTRANRLWAGTLLENLRSRDKASAYPFEMLDKKYPKTKFILTRDITPYQYNENYAYYLYIKLWGIKSVYWNTYLSISKCRNVRGSVCDNGRVLECDYLELVVNNIDYEIIIKSYSIKHYEIVWAKYALCGYLPDIYCRYLVELYEAKTKLKGDKDNEKIYAKIKEEINGCYGNFVTKLITDQIEYHDGYYIKKLLDDNIFEDLVSKQKGQRYKANFSYAQGVYVPAYQRKSLWDNVYMLDDDIVYMDTDSTKYFPSFKSEAFFTVLNERIIDRHLSIARRLDIDVDRLSPRDINGNKHPIGVYEVEENYRQFITLGAKRYAYVDDNNNIHIAVSGVSKDKGAKQLNDINEFKDGLIFDLEHSGKMVMHYQDEPILVNWNKGQYDEYVSEYTFGICGQPIEYNLSIQPHYKDILADCYSTRSKILIEKYKQIGELIENEKRNVL